MKPALRAVALAVAIVALDQLTKALVRSGIARGDENPVFPGVSLVNTRNRGVAFGLFENGGALVGIVTALALLALLVFFAVNRRRPYAWVPTGMLIGGAVGNLIDRARGDGVTDFVKVPLWPAFNVADVAITFGVLALVYVLEKPRA
jgi:signal peptidase II